MASKKQQTSKKKSMSKDQTNKQYPVKTAKQCGIYGTTLPSYT